MSTEIAGDPRTGLGARLRGARERKGLTVLQASEKLHVDPKVIDCLEAERFGELGAPVYVRGYLRHYAELVGESATDLQALYAGQVRVTPPDLTRIPKIEQADEPRQLLFPATLLVAGFALAGAVWWVLTVSSRGPVPPTRPLTEREPVPAVSAPSATVPATAIPGAPPRLAEAAGAGSAQHPAAALPPAGAAPSPALSRPAAQVPAAVQAAGPAPQAAQDGNATPAPAAPRARAAQLTLRYTADSWTEVYDSRGERLFYDVGTAGSVRTVQGRPPLSVVLGNAPGVVLEVDGRATDLAGHTRPDGSAQVQVSRSGRITAAAAPQAPRGAQDGG